MLRSLAQRLAIAVFWTLLAAYGATQCHRPSLNGRADSELMCGEKNDARGGVHEWRRRNDIMLLHNGEHAKPFFSEGEYKRRINRTRTYMQDNGLDHIVFTSFHNVLYHSGFLYCKFGRNYGLVISMDKVVSISALIDYGQPWRRTAVGENIVYTDWHQGNFFKALQASLHHARTVGIEYDHVTLDVMSQLTAGVSPPEYVDVSSAITKLRMVKSEEEIAMIRAGAEITEIGATAAINAIAEGVPEYAVARESTGAMVSEIARRYPDSELMDTWTWFQSGPVNTDGAHNPLTSRTVQKGDILSLNTFPHLGGYYIALERTLFFDHIPSERHLYIWKALVEVHELGMKLIRPGIKCSEIANKLNQRMHQLDVLKYRTFGYGHSFGALSHYYGRESFLELREDIDTELVPGMVISMEPHLTVPVGEPGAGGYREHDILVVTEDGHEVLTTFPYGPDHNIIKPVVKGLDVSVSLLSNSSLKCTYDFNVSRNLQTAIA